MQQKQAWGSGQISEEKQQQSSSSSSASNRVKCLDDVVLLRQIGEPTHKNTIPSRTEVVVGILRRRSPPEDYQGTGWKLGSNCGEDGRQSIDVFSLKPIISFKPEKEEDRRRDNARNEAGRGG